MKVKGVVPPLITPLDDRQRVVERDVETLVERLITSGIGHILLLGTMGEGPLLTEEQKKVVVKRAIGAASGRAKIIVNVSDTSTARIMAQLRLAEELGADGATSTLPIYLAPDSQAQVIDFFSEVASLTELPFFVYDMPRLVNGQITVDTYLQLSREDNIVGMKDSSGNFHRFRELILRFRDRDDFSLLTGDEWTIDASLFIGADGFVPGIGCLVPELCQELYESGLKGDIRKATSLQDRLMRIFAIYGEDAREWDAAMKEGLRQLGVISSSTVVRPMKAVDGHIRERVTAVLRQEKLL